MSLLSSLNLFSKLVAYQPYYSEHNLQNITHISSLVLQVNFPLTKYFFLVIVQLNLLLRIRKFYLTDVTTSMDTDTTFLKACLGLGYKN